MEDKLWRRRATTEAFSERRRILTQAKTRTQDQIQILMLAPPGQFSLDTGML